MSKTDYSEDFMIIRKDFFVVFLLLFNTFTWYYMTLSILRSLDSTYSQTLSIWIVYHLTVIGSSIAGSILSNRIRRLHFIYLWMILGIVASPLPILLTDITTTANVLIIFFSLGVSFGLGMPSCLAYFADCTHIENRGRMSGIIFSATNLSVPFLAILLKPDLTMTSISSAVWRGIGLIILLLMKPKGRKKFTEGQNASYISILQKKTFLLYIVPWLMFSLIDGYEELILRDFFGSDFSNFVSIAEPIIGTVSALIGGVLSDWIGRKRVVIYGFVGLGLAYGVMGIAPRAPVSWYFYVIADGMAWGLFFVIFVLVLWGDLSSPASSREKYYAIGSVPFFLADVFRRLSAPYVKNVPAYAAFSLASLFLFLAILPLIYASETLPERKIELRRLRKYVEKAKKIREKHKEKSVEN